MSERYLTILEVSQKQAYIFKSKRLKDNIIASDVIFYVTSSLLFNEIASDLYQEKENLVYEGGGHVILEFSTKQQAQEFTKRITAHVFKEFDGLEIFAKILKYEESLTPAQNVKELIKQLEIKKSMRKSAFSQGSFGFEKDKINRKEKNSTTAQLHAHETVLKLDMDEGIDKETYLLADKFENLGGRKNDSNFIAVIHIDGNQMGKRVAKLDEKISKDWKNYKKTKKEFSEALDKDFKSAYKEMNETVSVQLKKEEVFKPLDIDWTKKGTVFFPVRRIITAGDDICFVTEGRLGLECAAEYLRKLSQKENKTDKQKYSACAGVAIVHQKYPFYKAYELAEELCSNAKKTVANLGEGNGQGVSAIDWHIEFGEMEGGLSGIRKQYEIMEKQYLNLRPYLVCGDKRMEKDTIRRYDKFRELMKSFLADKEKGIARSKIKNLRTVLREGSEATDLYIRKNLLFDSIYWQAENLYFPEVDLSKQKNNEDYSGFESTSDGMKRNLFFDAIEMMDTMILFE